MDDILRQVLGEIAARQNPCSTKTGRSDRQVRRLARLNEIQTKRLQRRILCSGRKRRATKTKRLLNELRRLIARAHKSRHPPRSQG